MPSLIFLEDAGKGGIQAEVYYEHILELVGSPAFNSLLGYEGYKVKQEVGDCM
jgi:hypothetical protein